VLVADSAALATAYLDADARELVRLARRQRGALDASVFHYTATARQRVSAGIRALRRDRLLYRREVASTVDWWRDRPSRVVVQGAREAVPVALSGVRVPEDLEDWAESFVPRPGDDRLWINPSGGDFAWHPLVEGGESLYRYASGDTTSIRLPDGREVRLVELRVTPRERDIRVVTGSFWIELDGYGIVQAVFRPARDFDLERDLASIDPSSSDDLDDVPAVLKPVRFEIRYVTVEYGLWEMRWWMPRLMGFEGQVQLGPVRMPINLELTYSDYQVEADRYGLPELPPVIRELAGAPHLKPRPYAHGTTVALGADSTALLESPYLTDSFFAEGEALITDTEMTELTRRLGALPPPPWESHRPTLSPPWTPGTGLLRYNRVEGLSIGARVDWDLTRARLDLTGRIGTADGAPRGALGVTVPTLHRSWRLTAHRSLASVDPDLRPLGVGNSLTALLFGRDDGMYYQATGAALEVEPAGGRGGYLARVYAERQAAVRRETDFSLANVVDDRTFRPNIEADDADQIGVAGRIELARGLDPAGVRWGAALELKAETGSYTFVRPGLTLRGSAPLPGGLLGGVEVAGGTTLSPDTGTAAVPLQGLWYLGGPATLRGFDGGALAGRDLVRARIEVATELPAARLAVFSDAGWAGRFEDWNDADIAVSAGVGASFLDGLLRMDLARAFRLSEQWRADIYVDALF
jgi:hypothetical protein